MRVLAALLANLTIVEIRNKQQIRARIAWLGILPEALGRFLLLLARRVTTRQPRRRHRVMLASGAHTMTVVPLHKLRVLVKTAQLANLRKQAKPLALCVLRHIFR